jgi:adenine-specific DNA-methyltransferase
MNYLGLKTKLLPFIEQVYGEISDGTERTFCDLFAGTGAVSKRFQQLDFNVISNDIQYYSYVVNRAYLLTTHATARNALSALNVLNTLPGVKGFIAVNYSPLAGRSFFTVENAQRIDAIRLKIEQWHGDKFIDDNVYYYLLASLIEAADSVANTACVYEAFLKEFKSSALKPLNLKPIPVPKLFTKCQVFKADANDLVKEIDCDILYLDPPYNNRQYGRLYHLLETIAVYDNPVLCYGVAGVRTAYKRSRYSSRKEAKLALQDLITTARARHILLSYNNEGIIKLPDIEKILSSRGKVQLFQTDYTRFKADSGRSYAANDTIEYLYYLKVDKYE